MSAITVTRQVAAPTRRVWELIVDLTNASEMISAIRKVEILSGPSPLGVGTTWRETRVMFGREATETMTVTSLDPGRSYSTRAEGHGTVYVSTLAVEATGADSCVLSMSFEGRPTTAGARIMGKATGWLFTPATRKALAQDLADIAGAAEAAG